MSQFQPSAGRTLEERELEVRRAEQDVAALEAQQAAEVARMEQAFRELQHRLKEVKAAASLVQIAGRSDPAFAALYERLNVTTALPKTNLDEPRELALMARVEAINVRVKASERIRQAVHACIRELSRLDAQLSADATEIQTYQEMLEDAEDQAAQPRREEPKEERSPTAGRPFGGLRGRPPRVRMQTIIQIESGVGTFRGFSTNISEGGIFVATAQVLPQGAPLHLQFTLPGGHKISVRGLVRWVQEVNNRMPDLFPGMGVQFIEPDPTALEAIRQFVAERAPVFLEK